MNEARTSMEGGRRIIGLPISANEEPLITVITAVFNGADHVAEAIESVQQQDYPAVEHVVIDGGSTDGTVDILRKHNDVLAYWVSERDSGVYDAWNKGLALGKGEWIAFLGSDDVYKPGALSAYLEFLRTARPDVEYVSSRVEQIDGELHRLIGSRWNWRSFSEYMNVAHVGSLHRRSLFERVGTYDTNYRIVGDYELLLRARDTLRAEFLDRVTVTMRAGGLSDSTRALDEARRAKVQTGGRNEVRAHVEHLFAQCKFQLRRSLVNLVR